MAEVMLGLIGTVVGIAVGGYITYRVSKHYYLEASADLGRQAERLRKHTNLILRAMHNAGLAEVSWNEHGEPEGLVINLSGVITGGGGASGDLTVGREDDPNYSGSQ